MLYSNNVYLNASIQRSKPYHVYFHVVFCNKHGMQRIGIIYFDLKTMLFSVSISFSYNFSNPNFTFISKYRINMPKTLCIFEREYGWSHDYTVSEDDLYSLVINWGWIILRIGNLLSGKRPWKVRIYQSNSLANISSAKCRI